MPAKKVVNPKGVWESPTLSTAIQAGQLLFLSGRAALDEKGNVIGMGDCAAQTEAVMQQIKTILETAGSGMEHVAKITAFLTKMGDYPAYNAVRRKWFPTNPPASSTVIVAALVRPELLVEVEAVALIPDRGK